MFDTPEDYFEDNQMFSPRFYECIECGAKYDDERTRCADHCGGKVRGIYGGFYSKSLGGNDDSERDA